MWEDVEGQENFSVSAGFVLTTHGLLVQELNYSVTTPTYLSAFKTKKSLQKPKHGIYLGFKPHITNLYGNILKFSLQITASTFALCATYLYSEIGRQNIFSTPRLKSWNGKFSHGSLCEFTSSQKFTVLVSQASCLIMGQITPVLPGMKHHMEGIVNTDIFSPV